MAYIFDDWKELLENFQNSVEKDLEEIHKQKAEVQQIKVDIFNSIENGLFYRDDHRIVISAPEIIIGNVDKGGMMVGESGRVIIKGSEVGMEGVGDAGHIVSRAPSIRQIAVNPGLDGLENVVCDTSEIVSQACNIALHSSDAVDAFSQDPLLPAQGGISIHADNSLNLEAAVSAEKRKSQIENGIANLKTQSEELKKSMTAQKKTVDDCFKKMAKLLDEEAKLNDESDFSTRVNLLEIAESHEDMEDAMTLLYQSTKAFIHNVSLLAEVNRKKKALETEKDTIVTGDDFKNNSTGATMSVVAESIEVATADGDGNLHVNQGAGISVRTPRLRASMQDDKGKLVADGGLSVNAQNISFTTVDPSGEGKELPVVGNFNVRSKNIGLEAIDFVRDDKGIKEKELTKDSKITMTAQTVEMATTNPKDIERDEKGKITKGEYTAEGDVIIKSKTFTVESLDYEVADGELKAKALTKDSKIAVRSEKMDFLAADTEGKATGSVNINAKAVAVKSMDVDKEKLTDDKLAEGSTMTIVSEKMYVGAKSKDVKSKKFQAVSEEMGLFADKTFEAQQGDGKAVVQLDGGNASVGGSKTEVFGATTINDKTEVKGELKAPKVVGDSIEAKSAFKSPNISDGMAAGGGGGGGSLSAKLKTEDAPSE